MDLPNVLVLGAKMLAPDPNASIRPPARMESGEIYPDFLFLKMQQTRNLI